MDKIIDFLKIGYDEANERENQKLIKWNDPEIIKANVAGSLLSINEQKSWYYLFVEKDVVKAKQCFYLYGKIMEYLCNNDGVDISPGMAQDGTYTLLSDSKSLITSFANWQYRHYDYFIKRGETKYIIQAIAVNDDARALNLLDTFFKKHKKYGFNDADGGILRAILDNDKAKVEEHIHFLLLPKNHKKRNGIYPLRRDLLSFPALGFAKLAWLRGIEVDIDHPLLPKELLPIHPNEEYFDTYDFLKE
jgi:hypothetical protein